MSIGDCQICHTQTFSYPESGTGITEQIPTTTATVRPIITTAITSLARMLVSTIGDYWFAVHETDVAKMPEGKPVTVGSGDATTLVGHALDKIGEFHECLL
jgi:hypothetical protein